MKNILSTSNLSIGYVTKKATKTIAHAINLYLPPGNLIALVGGNGVGKSTLLRTLTGLQKPIKGTVFLNEKNIQTYNLGQLAQNLSLVLTEKLPPSNLTVFEIIALGRQPYTNWIGTLEPNDVEKINQAMALTQITHLATKKHDELSDGQLQKTLIARALAQDTPLIILDEPSTHLDLVHKVSVFKLLKKLTVETQKCILFSTHDIDMAIQLSDQIIVMTPDKITQDTPVNLIKDKVFDTLFDSEEIAFDPIKGLFVLL